MANLSYGSQGDDVKKLQEQLNKNGYSLDVDGIFGSKTQAAVKDYQSKNGLAVDGIVGVNTSSKLYGTTSNASNNSSNSTASTTNKVTTPTVPTAPTAPTTTSRPTYTQSNDVTSANQAVSDWETNKPGEYTSTYSDQINSLVDSIINGEKFTYDVNADALYNQYKDLYTQQGKQAMQDTMGQAAALTGGYGSSYATTAGSQAYQQYLNQLNEVVPELQDAAYQRYLQGEEDKLNNLSVIQNQESTDYNRYQDALSNYYTEGDYLTDKADTAYSRDYNEYLNDVSNYESDRDYEYNQYLAALDQYNIDRDYAMSQEEFEYQKAQDALEQSNWEKEYALEKSSLLSSGRRSSSSSSSSKSSKSTTTYGGYTESEIKSMANSGNYDGVISALSQVYTDTSSLYNKMTALGIDADTAKDEIEKYYGTSSSDLFAGSKAGASGKKHSGTGGSF